MKTNTKRKRGSIEIREEFFLCQTKALDSKHRITLGNKLIKAIGKKINVEAYRIFVSNNGDVLLRPTISIPSNEAWIYDNPEVIGRLRKGLKEASERKGERVEDVGSFLDSL